MSGLAQTLADVRGGLQLWWLAARPKTLTIAISPVILGSTIAWLEGGRIDLALFAFTLAAAVLIQAGTNLHNDAADEKADCVGRLGPPRVSAQGLLPAQKVRQAAYAGFIAAMFIGLYLVWRGGWPILAIGLASIAAGIAYSAGPRPISHTPLGELFVIVFFGLVGVTGTYWLQMHAVSLRAVLGGLVVGLPAAAVLLVNNTRDVMQDAAAGRFTLAMWLGRRGAAYAYAALVLLPYALLAMPEPGFLTSHGRFPWLPFLTLPYAAWLVFGFGRMPLAQFNLLLVNTAKLQFAIAALTSLALMQ